MRSRDLWWCCESGASKAVVFCALVDLKGRIRCVDPKLSLVLSSLHTAVECSPVMRRDGSGWSLWIWTDDGLSIRRRTRLRRRKAGGEWVAGCGLDQSKCLLRTSYTDQIRWFPLPLALFFFFSDALQRWISLFASGGISHPLLLRLSCRHKLFHLPFRSDVPAQAMNRGRRGASSEEGSGEFNSVAALLYTAGTGGAASRDRIAVEAREALLRRASQGTLNFHTTKQ
ncbi:LOW QUALITY PROTEIN: hypothetical protein HID58_057395, partial [Brassica napus]